MSDADTDGTEIESERDEAEAGAGGLRRAMEQRVKSLQDAEDRIRREQAALQEQAKVVSAEREARLARREKELAKREASITVSEGIADGAPHSSPDLEERERALAAREAPPGSRRRPSSGRASRPQPKRFRPSKAEPGSASWQSSSRRLRRSSSSWQPPPPSRTAAPCGRWTPARRSWRTASTEPSRSSRCCSKRNCIWTAPAPTWTSARPRCGRPRAR